MSSMGMNGNSYDRSQAGRFFAVLWILAAALAMQFVASAQVLSSRFSQQESAGNFAAPENNSSDTTLSRHVVRAFPVADLRFIADRADGKAAPGGPGPFVLPTPIFVAAAAYGSMAVSGFSHAAIAETERNPVRARGPPAVDA